MAHDIYLFLTLALLEIVLGVDNIIFLSIISRELPPRKRATARFLGLFFALILRIVFLLTASHLTKLKTPIWGHTSVHDLIFYLGGAYLLLHSLSELYKEVHQNKRELLRKYKRETHTMLGVVFKMGLIDLVFSIDTIMTAIGMTPHAGIIISAIFIAIAVMLFFSNIVSAFIERHVRVKRLALCFLVMVGVMLVCEGAAMHFNKMFLYAAIGFSLFVESINILADHAQRRRGLQR